MHMQCGSPRIIKSVGGSHRILFLLFYFLCLWSQTSGICRHKCKCNDTLLKVVCDFADLGLVPITLNPELRLLYLSNNNISAVKTSLSNYHNLDYLDLSENIIESLDKGNFKDLHHLRVLYLNGNEISQIGDEAFLGLNSLKELYLKKNSLESLSSEIFKYLLNLEILDISKNKISLIDVKAFYGLKSLKTLIIRGNNLVTIPSASFQHILNITSLDLGLNNFENIPENSFASLKSLEELFLDNCGLRVIMHGAFRFLNNLKVLHIQSNELNEIPAKALFDVNRLEELHIGQNNFFDIKPKSFQRLKFLHKINISNCQFLEIIGNNIFSENTNLKTIIFDFNMVLRHIQDGAFNNLPNIKHVSFRGNAFETLQHNLLPWEKLQSLDVRDNPLVCNCSLLWLWKLLLNKNYSNVEAFSNISQVVCVNPPQIRGKILPTLPEEDLDCNTLDTRRQVIIGIILAAAIASAAIVMVSFKYRDKVAGVLKTKWGYGRKEPQYQKTSAEEENTILQAAHQSLKLTPVTEL